MKTDFEQQQKEWNLNEANNELTKLKALKVLIQNNELACEIEIAGLSFGLCDNLQILPVLEFQEKEIKKYLKGKPSAWE